LTFYRPRAFNRVGASRAVFAGKTKTLSFSRISRLLCQWAKPMMGMSDVPDSEPLINDPAREASASMRGYAAQVWRSVLVWCELGDTERLYLEGAEDLDRVSGLSAEAIQVKDIVGNVTLRSSGVIEAIDNALAHQQRNPRHEITLLRAWH
jgi:hypothetical protein